jgi:hypothetical protein
MTISPEERLRQRQPRYSKEEFAQRGDALYESQIRLPQRMPLDVCKWYGF